MRDELVSPYDAVAYASWVGFAVVGDLHMSDAILRDPERGAIVRRVARTLRWAWPWRRTLHDRRRLYRGVLLPPGHDGRLEPDPRRPSVSFSECPAVARWFGSPDTVISGPWQMLAPDALGWIIELSSPPRSAVLFHWRWLSVPLGGQPLWRLAAWNPMIDVAQFLWNARTQREVVIELDAPVVGTPAAAIPRDEVARLDRRFVPPWLAVRASEKIRPGFKSSTF